MPINPVEITGGIAIGEGVGQAIGDVVVPKLQSFKNERWQKYAHVPLPGGLAARIIAEGRPAPGVTPGDDAAFNGISGDRFKAMVELARRYPTLSEGLALWRRNYANYGNVFGWLNRAGLSDEIVKQIIGPNPGTWPPPPDSNTFFYERLAPAQIALGIVRSIINDPGLMPVNLDTTGGAVEPYKASSIHALTEALDSGIDRERLRVLVGEIGLPMSAQQAASARFRKLVLPNGRTFDRADYYRAILEGDVRPEWADAIYEQARQILTAGEYAELQLRGFLSAPERRTKTAQHGMSPEDSNLLFDLLGRSINVHQIVTGEARGGVYKPPPATFAEQTAGIPPAFLASLERGNLRPEYYDLAYTNRYTYPSFFAIRALLQGNVITAAAGDQLLLEMGWKPTLARLVADHYGAATAVASDPHVTKAETQLWGTTHRSYIADESDDAQATSALGAAGVAATAVPQILALWQHERSLIRRQLTPAQIKKAYDKMATNAATGAAWTRDDALAALIARGYSVTDANDYLNIPAGK